MVRCEAEQLHRANLRTLNVSSTNVPRSYICLMKKTLCHQKCVTTSKNQRNVCCETRMSCLKRIGKMLIYVKHFHRPKTLQCRATFLQDGRIFGSVPQVSCQKRRRRKRTCPCLMPRIVALRKTTSPEGYANVTPSSSISKLS